MFFNFRQLPAFRTNEGKLFRGELFYRTGICREPFSEEDRLRLMTAGIESYVDLRTAEELGERSPAGGLADIGLSYQSLPVRGYHHSARELGISDEPPATEAYLAVTEVNRTTFIDFFRGLADQHRVPMVFGCAAGKDRTGILAALLFMVAGVFDGDIADDYAASAEAFNAVPRTLTGDGEDSARAIKLWPERTVMLVFLESFRNRWTSAEEYLSAAEAGLSAEQLLRLKQLLLR